MPSVTAYGITAAQDGIARGGRVLAGADFVKVGGIRTEINQAIVTQDEVIAVIGNARGRRNGSVPIDEITTNAANRRWPLQCPLSELL
jgi:hypothetical protein